MATYNPANVKVGVGTLYAAPIGTSEPTAVTGAWPAGWVTLGYTEQGSEFDFTPTISPIDVEEEFWPVRQVITAYSGKLTFMLAETTRQNFLLLLNNGIGSSLNAASYGANSDGSLWGEPPAPGAEVPVMLGWDAATQGAATALDPTGRLIVRSALQAGGLKVVRRKGANKTTYAAEFALQKPFGAQAFRMLWEATLAS
jgi:hypothetical protein